MYASYFCLDLKPQIKYQELSFLVSTVSLLFIAFTFILYFLIPLQDRLEYSKFEKERTKSRWNKVIIYFFISYEV